ncbi:MAG: hypothetical protein WBA44_17535 [Mesorhizobium sp.]
MFPLAQRNVPFRRFHIAGIDRIAQQDRNALVAHDATRIFREERIVLKKAHHVCRCLEAVRGKAFHRFLNDRCNWLAAAQHAPAILHRVILISDGCLERPEAVHQPGLHSAQCLLGILLPEVLRERRMNVLDHHRVSVVIEFHLRADKPATRFAEQVAQIPMSANVAREAINRIDDDGVSGAAILLEERHHRTHAGAVCDAAGHAVSEDLMDIEVSEARIFAACRFLRAQACAAHPRLLFADAAVNDGWFEF